MSEPVLVILQKSTRQGMTPHGWGTDTTRACHTVRDQSKEKDGGKLNTTVSTHSMQYSNFPLQKQRKVVQLPLIVQPKQTKLYFCNAAKESDDIVLLYSGRSISLLRLTQSELCIVLIHLLYCK